jgi:hypothetical protein
VRAGFRGMQYSYNVDYIKRLSNGVRQNTGRRMHSMIGKRFVALAAGLASCAHVTPRPPARGPTPVTVVLANRIVLPSDDSSQALTLVTRDVDTPDNQISGVLVVLARPEVDFVSPGARRVEMNPSGVQTVTLSESGEFRVLVRRLAYESLQFTLNVRPRCRQTIEIYLSRVGTYLDRPIAHPPTPGRVVLTTCSPPA